MLYSFAYAGGGLGKGGTATLCVDGRQVAESEVGATLEIVFLALAKSSKLFGDCEESCNLAGVVPMSGNSSRCWSFRKAALIESV